MSYERLAERLIETQRTMLGQRAVDIAASVEGLSVENDGSVSDVADDDREVVGTLVEEYTTIMGSSAANRLESTASEFTDDLVLPQNLGGPETVPDDSGAADGASDPVEDASLSAQSGTGHEADTNDEAETGAESAEAQTPAESSPETPPSGSADTSTETTTDDRRVRKATDPPTIDDITEPSGSESSSRPKPSPNGDSVVQSHESVTKLWEADDETDPKVTEADSDAEGGSADGEHGPTTDDGGGDGAVTGVEQGTQDTTTAGEQGQPESIDSVYVTRTDEDGWETPVPVGTAIAEDVASETDLAVADIDDLSAYVDTDRVITLLETDRSIPVSFRVEGHSVTIHPDGHVTVE